VFEKYLELKSYSALCEYLSSSGYKSKSWIKENGEIAGGGKYSKNILSCMLNSPVYIGQIRHKDKVYEGEHEAIIDIELWQQVQKLLYINFVIFVYELLVLQ
jgi:site-specific DNA recombinase